MAIAIIVFYARIRVNIALHRKIEDIPLSFKEKVFWTLVVVFLVVMWGSQHDLW
jgi:hypothetical protein